MIVVDASAAIEWALQSAAGEALKQRFLAARGELHAPHLIDLEVAQAFRRLVAAGEVTVKRADEAIADFETLSLILHPHRLFLWRIWELRGRLTAYDAAYVALAEALSAPIVTCDRRSAASRGHRARFDVV